MKTIRVLGVFTLLLIMSMSMATEWSVAQDLHPSRRLSPLGMDRAFVGDTYVKITFGQPYKRGRDNIFGEGDEVLHEYGEIWRFGANEPTEITFSGPVEVAGTRVEAGTYSIFARPGVESWTLYFNSLKGGGAGDYEAANDVATVEVVPSELAEEEDQFNISFEEQGDGLHMVTHWLNWQLEVPIMPAQ